METERSAEQLRLELEALAWAARAKDAVILALQRKLEAKQQDVDALAGRNAELERQLDESKRREAAAHDEAEAAARSQRKLEEAEERLCVQLGDLEAEYMVLCREHREQVQSLRQQLEEKENAAFVAGKSKSGLCRPTVRPSVLQPMENVAA